MNVLFLLTENQFISLTQISQISRRALAIARACHPAEISSKLHSSGETKGNGAKAHSSGGDKPPLRRKQRYHTALPSQPTPNREPSSLLEWPRCEGGKQ